MESNIKVFDREGNPMDIYKVVASFILEQEHRLQDDITIGVETYSNDRQTLCIYDLDYHILGSKDVNNQTV